MLLYKYPTTINMQQTSAVNTYKISLTSVVLKELVSAASKSSMSSRKNQLSKFCTVCVLFKFFGGGLASNLSSNSCTGISNFFSRLCSPLLCFLWWRKNFFLTNWETVLFSAVLSVFWFALSPECMFLSLKIKLLLKLSSVCSLFLLSYIFIIKSEDSVWIEKIYLCWTVHLSRKAIYNHATTNRSWAAGDTTGKI